MRNNTNHLPFLDGLRGIAILAVFLYHSLGVAFGRDELEWNGWVRNFNAEPLFLALYPLTYGSAGVAVFFVISGFCIHLSQQRSSNPNWVTFFIRRFFRIYPPYLVAVGIFFLWPWPIGSDGATPLAQLLSHVVAIHNLDARTYYGINPSFWSIAVEMQLYAIYPLLIAMVNKRGWHYAMGAVLTIEMVIRVMMAFKGSTSEYDLPYLIASSPFAFWFSWTIGAHVAESYIRNERSRIADLRMGAVALAAFLCPFFKPTLPFTFVAFALLTSIVIERFLIGAWSIPVGRFGSIVWRHLSLLGIVSFSFYLIHQPLLMSMPAILNTLGIHSKVPPMVTFGCCVFAYAPILVIAKIFYRFIELPSIEIGKQTVSIARSNVATKTIP